MPDKDPGTPRPARIATLEWVDWYNHRRLHEACDYRPPAEYEALYHPNQLTVLPDSLGNLTALTTLYLSHKMTAWHTE
ncbi:integrase core domain-containing protein [Dactylosporangium sp. NPDC051484]|uniref:integrase core domain-containing protein n=1 Tax=Dactylosporangium sp. NPDC051484 TaxID=3154942 RepID=UPI00344D0994